MTAPVLLRFGEFELDSAARKLVNGAAEVPLTPKAFDTLCYLVEHRDRVVTKEELRSHLWPDVAVDENALPQNISRVRKALGGRPYIETVSRIGYRFHAEVVEPAGESMKRTARRRIGFAMAAGVALIIGSAILLRLAAHTGRARAVDPQAFEAYVRGRAIWARREAAGHPEAGAYLLEAVRRDPGFALGWVGLADYDLLTLKKEETSRAISRALALDPKLGEAWATAGFYNMTLEWNWNEAGRDLKRAVDLAPAYEYGRKWFGEYLAIKGKPDDAVAQLQAAVAQHPDSPVSRAGLCRVLYFAGRVPEASTQCQIALDANPEFTMAHWTMYQIQSDLGNNDLTFVHWLEAGGRKPNDGNPFDALYRQGGLGAVWKELERGITQDAYFNRAEIAMRLGHPEAALGFLERSVERHEFMMTWAGVQPLFQPLHDNPRFQAIVRRMGL
jgi:DNA-binding winged helix-turn-helix (wHTH) protein/tetratricopeptide (TPR) repeat protein